MPHGGMFNAATPVLCAAFYNPPVILNRAAVKNPVDWTPKPQNTGSFTPFRMTEFFGMRPVLDMVGSQKSGGSKPPPCKSPKTMPQPRPVCAAFYNPPVILNRAAVKNPVNRTPKPQNTGSFTPFRMTEYYLAGGPFWNRPEAKKQREQILPCEDTGTLSARDAVSILVGIYGGGHAGDQQHHIVVIGF